MSEATKKAMIKRPASAVLPSAFETMSRLEQDMERMFHEFWRRPFLSLWDHERSWPGRMIALQMPAVDVYEEKDEVVVKAEDGDWKIFAKGFQVDSKICGDGRFADAPFLIDDINFPHASDSGGR